MRLKSDVKRTTNQHRVSFVCLSHLNFLFLALSKKQQNQQKKKCHFHYISFTQALDVKEKQNEVAADPCDIKPVKFWAKYIDIL